MVRRKKLQDILVKDIDCFSKANSIFIEALYTPSLEFCHFETPLVKRNDVKFIIGTKMDDGTSLNSYSHLFLNNEDSFFFLKGKNHDIYHLRLLFDKYENSSDPLVIEMAIEQLSNYGQVTFAEINYKNMLYEAYCEKQAWIETVDEFSKIYEGNDYNRFIIDTFNKMIFDKSIFSFIDPDRLKEQGIYIKEATSVSQIPEYFDKYSQLNLTFAKDYNIPKINNERNDSIKQRCDEHTGGYELLENLAKIKNPLEFNRELLALNLAIDDPRFHQNVERGVNLKHDFYNNFKYIPPSEKQKIIDRANEICREIKKDYRLEDITPERDKEPTTGRFSN